MTYQPLPLAERITVHEKPVDTGSPPDGLLTLEDVGLLSVPGVQGQVIYRAPGTLFETRATRTPGGDYLLMFPTDSADHDPAEGNCHYGRADRKINDLVALRSSDGGETWRGPRIAFAIDYNQHGFVPFIPRPAAASIPSGRSRSGSAIAAHRVCRRTPRSATGGRTMTATPGAARA